MSGPSCSKDGLCYPPDKWLSSGQVLTNKNHAIHWIEIYPMENIIHLSNNAGYLMSIDTDKLTNIIRWLPYIHWSIYMLQTTMCLHDEMHLIRFTLATQSSCERNNPLDFTMRFFVGKLDYS